MATSVDEALTGEWQATHPYRVDVECQCGETWRATFLDGEPISDDALDCVECGGEGEPS